MTIQTLNLIRLAWCHKTNHDDYGYGKQALLDTGLNRIGLNATVAKFNQELPDYTHWIHSFTETRMFP